MSMEKTAAAKVLREGAIALRQLSADNVGLREKLASAEAGLEAYQRASKIVDHMDGRKDHHEKVAMLLGSGRSLDVIEEAVSISANPEALRLTKVASSDNGSDETSSMHEARIDGFLLSGELEE